MNKPTPRWLIGLTAVVYFFLHLPVLVLVVFSFNDSKFSVDWRGFTLQWYQRLWERPDILRGLKASLIVGSAATVISAVLGTLLALALARQRFRGRRALEGFLYVPIVTPEIVTGISLLLLFALLKFPRSHDHHHCPRGFLYLLRGHCGAGAAPGNG
jgi:spermidine/putrescine transport system permease protein